MSIRSTLAALAFCLCAPVSAQTPPAWTLDALLEPVGLPGLEPDLGAGFGAAVALGPPGWLVVSASGATCGDPTSPGETVESAGRIYFFQRAAHGWDFKQSFCAANPAATHYFGRAMRASGPWLAVGDPYTEAEGGHRGRIELFRFNETTQRWTRHSEFRGELLGGLGSDVDIDGEWLVAGEPGHFESRGRVRTWRLTGNTWVEQAPFALASLSPETRFGAEVSLTVRPCAGAGCVPGVDIAARGGDQVHLATRVGASWQPTQTLNPPNAPGTYTLLRAIDLGRDLLAFGYYHGEPSGLACATQAAVRVYQRESGGGFGLLGDVCQPSHAPHTFGSSLALSRDAGTFFVGSPDVTAFGSGPMSAQARIDSYDTALGIQHVDTQYEFSLAPVKTGTPYQYNDAYGESLAQSGAFMAVGARWAHVYWTTPGVGYVAVYRR